jgi:ribose/xylose/arabinose/galactoside ABC-type transport system permease subunit
MSYFLIAACGLTFVIMTGSFDFSVISILKLAALLSVLYVDQLGLWVVPLALLVGVGFGFINGLLVAKFKVPSFMATLGVSVLVEGIALYLSKGFLLIMDNETFRGLATTFIAGLPSIFYWAMAIWILSTFIALVTPFGRRIYAVGGNPTSAGLSGINVEWYRIYVLACWPGWRGCYTWRTGGAAPYSWEPMRPYRFSRAWWLAAQPSPAVWGARTEPCWG